MEVVNIGQHSVIWCPSVKIGEVQWYLTQFSGLGGHLQQTQDPPQEILVVIEQYQCLQCYQWISVCWAKRLRQ